MRPTLEPKDPNFEARVRSSFGRQKVMETLGITMSAVGPGWVELEFTNREDLTQQHGFIHAGVLATALDSACGYAAFSLMPPDSAVLTVEYKINLLRPANGDQYVAKAWVIKPGRTLTVVQASADDVKTGDSVAAMTATLMTVEGRGLVD